MKFSFIGAAIGACAGIKGCEKAPSLLRKKIPFEAILAYEGKGQDYKALSQYFAKISRIVYSLDKSLLPFVIGGDHSCAIGTWQGVLQHHHELNQEIGLIWVDAHMDSHTPLTSLTGNVHGMPLAVLMGYGHKELIATKPKLKPENVVLMRIRSYERDEANLIKRLGVKAYFMDEIVQRGIDCVFREAFQGLSERVKVGLSIDLDGFDPRFVPGVGTPVKDGIDLDAFIHTVKKLNLSACCGVEITEYNPILDRNQLTQINLLRLVSAFTNKDYNFLVKTS